MKKTLRQQALQCRKTLNLGQISEQICKNISTISEYICAENIGIFYPKEVEINILSLCKDKAKKFFLPKVSGETMEFYRFTGEDELVKGEFGIYEPKTNQQAEKLDVIVTPALMADKRGYRLGWGGGFYDRYLENFSGIIICPVPHSQLVDVLPSESYDKKCNFVVTENKIIKIL